MESASATGSISSPNYPSNYDNFGHCIWLIEAPTGHAISLNISHLALEQSGDGSCLDYLQVMIYVHKKTVPLLLANITSMHSSRMRITAGCPYLGGLPSETWGLSSKGQVYLTHGIVGRQIPCEQNGRHV